MREVQKEIIAMLEENLNPQSCDFQVDSQIELIRQASRLLKQIQEISDGLTELRVKCLE